MATPNPSSARFRPATDFPKTVESLSHSEVSGLYAEMRECLIFTNRSRGQLLRRNEEHKQSTLQLRQDIERFQALVNHLNRDKQQLVQEQQAIVSSLQAEIGSMTTHLDQLSTAFDSVADVETQMQSQWSFLALPSRFFSFVRAVKAIVTWWREEKDEPDSPAIASAARPQLPGQPDEQARQEQPQMYTDPASQGRSLLDK